ncbi:hypothetical protein B0F90DRAFT_1624855 [Multifurca ochricompacta]|uniref:RPA43 OB domain-containing protein n=1 Tax=Multifurca ochricompacta TaxID=376703 RepID=A0AAD4M891_9AGAM|nr:hypothetical protein B0F90DRAFT_1624855 [Multifurca ochricompacta]
MLPGKLKRKNSPVPRQLDAPSKRAREKGKEKAASPSEFRSVKASIVLAIPPVFANRLRDGVDEMLDAMVMRYEPTLNGVVLAHSGVHFLDRVARLQADSPFAICHVGFDALIWSPLRGMKLAGRVTLCSPDHISLLMHRTFNVSIPRHHIPTDQWEFEYGPAQDDDTEYGTTDEDADVDMTADVQVDDPLATDQRGRWVHKVTGDRLGGKDRWLPFTVVGLTVANQMLSIVGSIQPNPFSPDHVPKAKSEPAQDPQSPTRLVTDPIESEASDDDEVDARTRLSPIDDEPTRKEKEGKQRETRKQEKGEKKRKSKEDKTAVVRSEAMSEHKPKRKKAS